MPWARASALHRHLECGAASTLPRAERGLWRAGYLATEPLLAEPGPRPDDDSSVLAGWGTEMHKAKENAPDSNPLFLSWMDPHRETLWPAHLGEHEVPVAYDCRTGDIEVGRAGDSTEDKDRWKQSRGRNTVTGTMDWWGKLPGGEPWVDDLKTGWAPPQLLSPQMLYYALVASVHTGSPTVRVSITHWRRGWDEPQRKWQQVGPVVLDQFASDLRTAWERAVKDPRPRVGAWCRWCPSVGICPAQTEE
jgi:hypothetical protein